MYIMAWCRTDNMHMNMHHLALMTLSSVIIWKMLKLWIFVDHRTCEGLKVLMLFITDEPDSCPIERYVKWRQGDGCHSIGQIKCHNHHALELVFHIIWWLALHAWSSIRNDKTENYRLPWTNDIYIYIYFAVCTVWSRVKQRPYPQGLPRLFLEQESELKFRQGYRGIDGC